ncbi:thiamine-phosphate pyrophosphorylase [Campylobacter fetus subsp. testudinum]|uniref:thiamine phosphate synthase n=1 Tax=Campylobacter fetus TaxID=196 RepID=UPI000818B429|nr:thiamine phosphate synthase [Campylobacter fetus]MPB71832.1 thiamine phosphate synthase [Campylobacter fetus]MPB77230.1 thiamine phosphate synthase [Campylobacter fetus]OCR86553.1 thiamine-phosphate pyrophosphorylase [Campylobacter fetus subsp. testudinum]OCS04867.1 thiamine-phosphate pyrophosphorylase [Campylobacter fetus subsp. testudinum]
MCKLYVLTDSKLTPQNTIFDQILELLNSGVKLVQYRNKMQNHDMKLLKSVVHLCDDFNAKLIINDDPFLAKTCGAHGVHIGKDDENIKKAKELLGKNSIIGVSCYNDINLALKAQKDGASYVAFGAMYPSKTKPNAPLCDHDTIKKAKEILGTPICVIGGINELNLKEVSDLKPDLIAIINAAYSPKSISENISNLNKIIRN